MVTNVDRFEKAGYRTGLWLGELTHFHDVAEAAGFAIGIASPSGGKVPIDPESVSHAMLKDGGTGERYDAPGFMALLDDTMRVEDARLKDYDAIYMTGGHGVTFDFPRSRALTDLTARFFESGRVVAAVCHGPAGLLEARTRNGEYLIKGRKVTGFSWTEEEKAGRDSAVPFTLEGELQARGAAYEKAWMAGSTHVVEDGLLVTGQNSTTARAVGEAVVRRLAGA